MASLFLAASLLKALAIYVIVVGIRTAWSPWAMYMTWAAKHGPGVVDIAWPIVISIVSFLAAAFTAVVLWMLGHAAFRKGVIAGRAQVSSSLHAYLRTMLLLLGMYLVIAAIDYLPGIILYSASTEPVPGYPPETFYFHTIYTAVMILLGACLIGCRDRIARLSFPDPSARNTHHGRPVDEPPGDETRRREGDHEHDTAPP